MGFKLLTLNRKSVSSDFLKRLLTKESFAQTKRYVKEKKKKAFLNYDKNKLLCKFKEKKKRKKKKKLNE